MKKNVFQNTLLIDYFKFILDDIENLEVPQHEPYNNNNTEHTYITPKTIIYNNFIYTLIVL